MTKERSLFEEDGSITLETSHALFEHQGYIQGLITELEKTGLVNLAELGYLLIGDVQTTISRKRIDRRLNPPEPIDTEDK